VHGHETLAATVCVEMNLLKNSYCNLNITGAIIGYKFDEIDLFQDVLQYMSCMHIVSC